MRLALLTETYSPNMGYMQNILPRYLNKLGVEVHLITMDLLPYHHQSDLKKTSMNAQLISLVKLIGL